MAITLTAEQETTLRRDAVAAGFESAEEYLASRLESLHAEEELFAANRDEWTALINEGLDAADRGELLAPEEAKAQRDVWKREFLAKSSAA